MSTRMEICFRCILYLHFDTFLLLFFHVHRFLDYGSNEHLYIITSKSSLILKVYKCYLRSVPTMSKISGLLSLWGHSPQCSINKYTHTHVGICGLRGLSIGIMVFIVYKLYFLLPYPNPTPKPTPHRKISAVWDFQNIFFCVPQNEKLQGKEEWWWVNMIAMVSCKYKVYIVTFENFIHCNGLFWHIWCRPKHLQKCHVLKKNFKQKLNSYGQLTFRVLDFDLLLPASLKKFRT